MLSPVYVREGDPTRFFIEAARPQWACKKCADRDRLFFVISRNGDSLEHPFCLPCVLNSKKGKFPAQLIKKLDDFVTMERLRDAGKKEEGV